MKTSSRKTLGFILMFGSATLLQAQSVPSQPGQTTLPPPTPYAVVAKDANSSVWQRTVYEFDLSGKLVPKTHSYIEVATGLHYKQNGQWLDSKEEVVILPNGTAAAMQGQHQAYFPSDIYNGRIELDTPDGEELFSQPLCLSYFDGTNTVVIAELTNSIGLVAGNNQVIYPNAFTGFSADLRYTYTKAGFEQDIILHEQPPTPESLGLNPATSRLQVLTEFFSPPQPTVRSTTMPVQAGLSLSDETVGFGAMQMIQGRAFLLGQNAQDAGALVSKQWLLVNGRQLLVEEVPVDAIVNGLAALPLKAMNSGSGKAAKVASRHPVLPSQRLVKNDISKTRMLAKADRPAQGFVLDYQTVNSSLTNFTFQGDTTYYISGSVNIYGTNTFEGGTVLKYASPNWNNFTLSSVNLMNGSVFNCKTSPYRPAVFTAIDDNTVGETISGSTGNPTNYYAYPALQFNNSAVLSNFRIAYANQAINAQNGSVLISHGQLVNCSQGINYFMGLGQHLTVQNLLFANVASDFFDNTFTTNNLASVGNTTFSGSAYLGGWANLCLTNCILANVTNIYQNSGGTYSGDHNGFYKSPVFGTSQVTNTFYPFQTVGGGSYYLTNGCSFINAGTTNIDPTLLASLQQKTTYPPIVYSNVTISVYTTLSPQAQRDIDSPDLGYHYDPLDYAFSGAKVLSPGSVTFNAGTAVAWFSPYVSNTPGWGVGTAAGLAMSNNAAVTFNGTATSPCQFVNYANVQEGCNAVWMRGYLGGIANRGTKDYSSPAILNASFTHFSHLSGDVNHYRDGESGQELEIRLKHCELLGSVGGYNFLATYTNCLFDRVTYWQGTGDATPYEIFRNCAFHGGSVGFTHWENNYQGGPPFWYSSVRDCAFDGTTFSIDDPFGVNTNYADYDFNAYLLGAAQMSPEGTNNVVVTSSFNWQSSWFGNYYQSINSLLINKGDRTADHLGIYHFTTQTNQVKEANSFVDIGYHYVATDAYGNPLDTDGDSIPDYIEDANGNGVVDPGETSWTNWDTDGDGLSDSEETKIFLDANNPSLGYLDPLNPDTGNTGIPDGQKDADHDGLSNLGELRIYHSDPNKANSLNPANTDAAYLFTANNGGTATKATFSISHVGTMLYFTIAHGTPNSVYDLYYANSPFAQRWMWRRVYPGMQCDSAGNATVQLQQPDFSPGYFEFLSATDTDGDGLSDGYEAWFNYNGYHTVIDNPDSDGDGMLDGWEVEYGLNPSPPLGQQGADGHYGNPDNDAYYNYQEYVNSGGHNASYDPLEPYNTSYNRPVASVQANSPYPGCEQSSFTIHREVGLGGNLNNPLTVYYSVGGTLSHDAGVYTLNPLPPDWPRIYSATIQPNQYDQQVTVDAPGVCPNPGDVQTVVVALTPYGVAANLQVSNPLSWLYVVDLQQGYDHATITYENQNLRPSANVQSVQMCPGNPPKQITLSGVDSCGANLSFRKVDAPQGGTLSAITSINGSSASVTYTPNNSFCGQDGFTFVVNDGVRDSAPALVTVDVGDPNLTISPTTANGMVGKNASLPVTFGFSGSDICGGPLTFSAIPGYPQHGTLTITPVDATHATVSYHPNSGFEEMDSFYMIDNDCGFSCQSPAQIKVFVVGGPILMATCNPFQTGVGVLLQWSLDSQVQNMIQEGLKIKDYKIYRANVSGGPYTPLATTPDGSQTSYWDTGAGVVSGQTYYYVVTFQYQDPNTSIVYESPYSNESSATAQQSVDLVPPTAYWDVTDITDPNNPNHLGSLQAPFGDPVGYDTQFPAQPPLVPVNLNTHNVDAWAGIEKWDNHITLNLTGYTSGQLAQVKYSIAIDNYYSLYVNGQLVTNFSEDGGAKWSAFQTLPYLVAGSNDIEVVISNEPYTVCYFSMVVTADSCVGP